MIEPRTEIEAVSLRYAEAYERALLADEAFRKAGTEHTEALHVLREAEAALQKWHDGLTAHLRLAVKKEHPEIDPTRTITRPTADGDGECARCLGRGETT